MADEPEHNQLTTQVALLRQDLGHMGSDIADIKQDFKEFKAFYATKEEMAYFKSEWKSSYNVLSNQLKTWKNFMVAVAVIVVASLILAYVFHIGIPAK